MVDWKKKKNVEDIYYYFIAKKQESFLKNHCGTRPIECYSSKKKKTDLQNVLSAITDILAYVNPGLIYF